MNWIAVSLSLIGIILNAKKSVLCWAVWIISNIFWLAYEIPKGELPSILLWSAFLLANIYGWYCWRKQGN